MSHHGREYEDETCGASCSHNSNQLGLAVELIKAIANGYGEDGTNGNFATTTVRQACDQWLDKHGYPCESSKRRQRERRAEQLDQEIAKLQQERESLK